MCNRARVSIGARGSGCRHATAVTAHMLAAWLSWLICLCCSCILRTPRLTGGLTGPIGLIWPGLICHDITVLPMISQLGPIRILPSAIHDQGAATLP